MTELDTSLLERANPTSSRRSLLKGALGVGLGGALAVAGAGVANADTQGDIFTYAKRAVGASIYISGAAGGVYQYPGLPGSHIQAFDCSGLVQWAARGARGISIPHWTHEQPYASRVHPVTGFFNRHNSRIAGSAHMGDLVYFYTSTAAYPEHVGFYAGGGRILNARCPGTYIRYDSIESFTGYSYVRGYRIW